MKLTQFSAVQKHPGPVVCAALALSLALVACGGGGATQVTDVTATPSGARALTADFMSRKAVNYSPFRTATTVGDSTKPTDISNEIITDEMVLQDLNLLQNAGFGLIRIFNSDTQVAETVLRVIGNPANKLDLKVYLGMWMAGYNDAGNKQQMALGVALANSYPNIVVAVSVGNESMVNWSDHRMDAKVLAANLATVRSQIKQPVTTDDNWAYYASADRAVLDTIDFAAVHTYVMVDTHYLPVAQQWNWKQLNETDLTQRAAKMMDAAMSATKSDYAAARNFLDSKGYTAMPIVIGETGWMNKDPGSGWYKFLAHPVNQKMYFERLTGWANEGKTGTGPKNVFYFEAFDEQWKGSDDGWGLFNKNREARYAVQSLKANGSALTNCVVSALNNCKWKWEAGTYSDADALYFKLPKLNTAVTDAKLVIHSEAINGWPDGLRADAYEGDTFKLDYPATGDSASGDSGATLAASKFIKLSAFTPKDYGWGLLWQSTAAPTPVTANMSNFANGAIHFSVKTSYVGKLRVGISSDTELGDPVESNLVVVSGNYGYCTNVTAIWCDVSIPVSAFKAANPALDLRYILTRFSVADIYSETGNTARTGMPDIALDNIYWAQ
jgi:exo-beta-1,3-glucanase (GH17 family)